MITAGLEAKTGVPRWQMRWQDNDITKMILGDQRVFAAVGHVITASHIARA